jgi:hypothetical protein
VLCARWERAAAAYALRLAQTGYLFALRSSVKWVNVARIFVRQGVNFVVQFVGHIHGVAANKQRNTVDNNTAPVFVALTLKFYHKLIL